MYTARQALVDKVLPKSQCGFCKERGCVDMIFTVRQLRGAENTMTLFLLTPQQVVMTQYLERFCGRCCRSFFGVLPVMLSLIKLCHDGITAVVRVSDGTTDDFNIRNGLRQRCTMAPVLLNLYYLWDESLSRGWGHCEV